MTTFEIIAILMTFTAAGGYINLRYMRLPATIGNMTFALIASMLMIGLNKLGWLGLHDASAFIKQIDFSAVLLHGMLAFLLFAGALHIRLDDLRNVKRPVAILATFGVVAATVVTGSLVWLAAGFIGIELPYVYAMLFGALISPTDPIAVLAMLKKAGISKNLYVKIGAESLFNDGVGVVIYLTILSVATSTQPIGVAEVLLLLAQQAVGGALLGLLLGWIAYRLMQSIDEYNVEVMLTLALVTGGYALAEWLHMSAPICVVVAGLVTGNQGRAHGMSDTTRQHLDIFWELVDEILNAVLFLLVGFEIVTISLKGDYILLGVMAIAAVLAGRFISVALPIGLMSLRQQFERGTIRLLIWGGLRGGLSIAMALALPECAEKDVLITVTYVVVLFSILVQGLTFQRLVQAVMQRR